MERQTMIELGMVWGVLAALGLLLFIFLWKRLKIQQCKSGLVTKWHGWALSQTTGNKEIQADIVQVSKSEAGVMAIMADGIGKANTGKVAAQVAVDTVLDAFEPYQVLNNPGYLFRTAFQEAHSRVQRTIGERRGGTSVGAIFCNGTQLHYALAGNIRIAMLRNRELIPLSKGQTLNVLAKDAYKQGLLSKQETIWSQEETRIWNYLGKDGFREIEVCTPPIKLKAGDLILMMSQGIFEELSWAETEEILLQSMTLKKTADTIIMEVDKKESQDKENGSVLLLVPEVTDEKNQF